MPVRVHRPDASRLIQICAERQQVIGVRLGTAEQTAGDQIIRTVGRVAADETRIFRINAAVDGWIQELKANATGVVVRKDDVLGAYYAPEFLGAQQAYLYALGALDRFQKGSETPDQNPARRRPPCCGTDDRADRRVPQVRPR